MRSAIVLAAVAAAAPAEEPELGFPGHPPELRARLARALAAAQATGGDLRTEHLRPDGTPRFANRLLLEGSPYLRQHAHNPVDWYPWGEEAFAAAGRLDRPIFLSIGYSTCHWCHVMERESFDDLGIAALLAEGFVAIKVDREERPDLDEIYMIAIQLTGRAGGWPLQTFLTPDGRPFFSTTYLPRERLAEALRAVSRMWRSSRAEVEVTASSLAAAVGEVATARADAAEIDGVTAERAAAELLAREDRDRGGFGAAPKFPHEPELLFLLGRALRGAPDDASARAAGAAAERALAAMARGGIYDQVGGGFHRYATDAEWRLPHFEKMLYNQALQTRAYLAGYRLTGRESFRRVAVQTLGYLLREMSAPEGGFYAATDADSEGGEGRFFVWTPDGLRAALGDADGAWAAEVLGVTPSGSFEDGASVLWLPRPLDQVAAAAGAPLAATLDRLDRVRGELQAARARRPPPLRDDKLLVAWNALAVTALAEGTAALGEERWLEAAERAVERIWSRARRGPGRFWRVLLDGRGSVPALLEDHAYLAESLLTLYDVTGERRFLERAGETLDGMIDQFWDGEGGGFFASPAQTGPGAPIARPKSAQDSALPSGNAVALRALAMDWRRSGDAARRGRAESLVAAFSGLVEQSPSSFPYLLEGLRELEHGDTGTGRWAAAGKVAVRAGAVRDGTGGGGGALSLRVELTVAPGWHVNSSSPLEPSLLPTALALADPAAGWTLGAPRYPEGRIVRLGFQEEPLSVYTGTVVIGAALAPPADPEPGVAGAEGDDPPTTRLASALAPVRVSVRLQACDDRICLRPEELVVPVAVAPLLRPADAPF